MMLAQPVTEGRLDPVDLDRPARQQRPHLRRADCHGVAHPLVTFPYVRGEDMLRNPVDVPERAVGELHRGREGRRQVARLDGEFPVAPLHEAGLADPVGAQQFRDRHSALSQSAGVLDRGGRGSA